MFLYIWIAVFIIILFLYFKFGKKDPEPSNNEDDNKNDTSCDGLPKPKCFSGDPACVSGSWYCSFYNLGTDRYPAFLGNNSGRISGTRQDCGAKSDCGVGAFYPDNTMVYSDVGDPVDSSSGSSFTTGYRLQPYDLTQKDTQFFKFKDVNGQGVFDKKYAHTFNNGDMSLSDCENECVKSFTYIDSNNTVNSVNGCFGYVYIQPGDEHEGKTCTIYKINNDKDLNNVEKDLRDPKYVYIPSNSGSNSLDDDAS